MSNEITIGSCFAGIGGFELGLERGIPNSKTVWQIEQNKYCQTILQKHWPDATIYDDIREIDYEKMQTVDIICGGFPCQDISAAGKGKGIEHGDRSGLWRQMHRLINHIQPRVAVLENVPALLWKNRGMHIVLQDLASIGYDAEWCTISARQFGAPHLRKRVFIIAYPSSLSNRRQHDPRILHDQKWHTKNNQKVIRSDRDTTIRTIHKDYDTRAEIAYPMQIRCRQDGQQQPHKIDRDRQQVCTKSQELQTKSEHSNSEHIKANSTNIKSMETQRLSQRRCSKNDGIQQRDYQNYWQRFPTQSPLCHRDDGVPNRLARLRALGNAIVPQCSEYIGKKIYQSNLLDYKF
jgi:DNA (cytosine-5)-methyltransferase 1